MSYPILYSAMETEFDHNGFGILGDCVSCEVTEEANGIFELTMQYPMDGIHFEDISDRSIIKAKADQFRDPQLFRVYATSSPMNGIVTVSAEHISYDLSGIPVSRFSSENVNNALSGLKENAITDCPFTFWTNMTTAAKFEHKIPASIRSKLGGSSGSILDVYGGELEFDNYTVKLHNNRGMNRGVSIRYGKNLTDIKQDQNCSNVVTGIYPYWYLETDVGNVLIELPEKIVNVPGTHNFSKIKAVDFTQYFELQPTYDELRQAAKNYIASNNVGVPKVSMKISFAQLEQSEEYRHLKLLERVALFDTVNVEFPVLGVSATAKAVKMVYDVLADRVKSVNLGSVRANIADTIALQQQEIEKKPSKTFMEQAIESLTKTILGAKGGSVRFLDENGDGEPDTLYIADNPDPEQAVKVWRFNYEGWGASKNGYNGPFEMGATLKDGIVADFITAGTLYGILVKAGAIQSLDGKININLGANAEEPVFNSGISTNGLTVRADEAGSETLFKIDAYQNPNGEKPYYGAMHLNSANGTRIFNLLETFSASDTDTPVGCALQLIGQDNEKQIEMLTSATSATAKFSGGGTQSCIIQANQNAAGLFFLNSGTPVGGISVNESGGSTLVTKELNAKIISWKSNGDGTYTLIGQ